MYCAHCGAQLETDALFCSNCGRRVSSETSRDLGPSDYEQGRAQATPSAGDARAAGSYNEFAERVAGLIKRVQAGRDSEAFAQLFEQTKRYVAFCVRSNGVPESAVDDVLQNVYISVYNDLGSLRDPRAGLGWIKGIAYHRSADFLRARRDVLADEATQDWLAGSEEGGPMDDGVLASSFPLPENVVESAEVQQVIRGFIHELPENQQRLFIARYVEEVSAEDIARTWGLNANTVRSQLLRVRRTLQAKIDAYGQAQGCKLYAVDGAAVAWILFHSDIASMHVGITAADVMAAAGLSGATSAAAATGSGMAPQAAYAPSAAQAPIAPQAAHAASAAAKAAGGAALAKTTVAAVIVGVVAGVAATAAIAGGAMQFSKAPSDQVQAPAPSAEQPAASAVAAAPSVAESVTSAAQAASSAAAPIDESARLQAAIAEAQAQGLTVYHGTARIMTGQELLDLQVERGISGLPSSGGDPRSMFEGSSALDKTFEVLVLDEPTDMTCQKVGDSGVRSGMARLIEFENSELQGRDGQSVYVAIDLRATHWPSDASLPLGEPRTLGTVRVLG